MLNIRLRVAFEYSGEQEAVTGAHIRNAFNAAEIVGIENGACLEARVGGHRLVKILGLVRAVRSHCHHLPLRTQP